LRFAIFSQLAATNEPASSGRSGGPLGAPFFPLGIFIRTSFNGPVFLSRTTQMKEFGYFHDAETTLFS
jgi:hypothetical protein